MTKACRYEPVLNRSYKEMARHYGAAIVPARRHRPKDKGAISKIVRESVDAAVEPLQVRMAVLGSEMALVKADVTLLKGDVAQLKGDVSSLSERMGLVEGFIRGVGNAADQASPASAD